MTVRSRHNTVRAVPIDSIKPQVIGYNGCRLGLAAEKHVVPRACLHLHWDMTTRDGGNMAQEELCLDGEEWRDVVGYEGYYQVSNLGRVRSLDRIVKNSRGYEYVHRGKVLSPSNGAGNYLYVAFTINCKTTFKKVHRLVAETFMPSENHSFDVHHINGNKYDNRLENLMFISKSEHASKFNGISHNNEYVPIVEDALIDLDGEEWRAVVGYEGLYEISSLGRIRSLDRDVVNRNGQKRIMRGRLLCPVLNSRYYGITLSKDGEKKRRTIHSLVADAFLERPENTDWVGHINGDILDNRVANLKWSTMSECNKRGYVLGLRDVDSMRRTSREYVQKHGTPTPSKPVIRNDGVWFESGVAAARAIGTTQSNISAVARGTRKSIKGYTFKFAEQTA